MNKFLLFASTLFIAAVSVGSPPASVPGKPKLADKILADARKGKISLNVKGFEENKGQLLGPDGKAFPRAKFHFKKASTDVFLLENGLVYQFTKIEYPEGYFELKESKDPRNLSLLKNLGKKIVSKTYRMDMVLEGAQPHPQIITEGRSEDFTNYYAKNVEGVHYYQKVTYKNVYPKIDWVLYQSESGLKYDFVVSPGGDPSLIKMKYEHQKDLKINEDGSFSLISDLGSFREEAPISFQAKSTVKTNFRLSQNTISFDLGKYDLNKKLVIDPSVTWATLYGNIGFSFEEGFACATDASGNVYLNGWTRNGSNGISTAGAFNQFGSVGDDHFLVKFNSSGVRQWGTYYGGTEDETYNPYGSCTVDPSGNVYLTGTTSSSTGIASPGSYQSSHSNPGPGGSDMYLAKFNTSGTRLWATYYGGASDDFGMACATDASGNVYLAGTTLAGSGLAFGGHQNSTAGAYDGVLVKFDANGTRLWATYYGGDYDDYIYSAAVDPSGNVFIGGTTQSTAAIASGGHQNSKSGTLVTRDGFLVKFNSSGVRQWGTYYGGTADEVVKGCATDASGNVIIVGVTESTTNISSGGHQSTYGGNYDGFVVKFNGSGVRQWGSYYGGPDPDQANAVCTDAGGNVYMVGVTSSSVNIASGGFQNTGAGPADEDAMVVKFNANGVRQWGSYLGGSGVNISDNAKGCTIDASGALYVSGTSWASSGGLATIGAHQTSAGGSGEGFLAKICVEPNMPVAILGPATVCPGGSAVYSVAAVPGATSYSWTIAGGWIVSPSSISNISVSVLSSGNVSVSAVNACGSSVTRTLAVTLATLPAVGISSSTTTICSGRTATLTGTGAVGYVWSGGPSTASFAVSPTITTSYTVTGTSSFGCTNEATVNINVNATPGVSISASTNTICNGQSVSMIASGASTYSWTGGPATAGYNPAPSTSTTYVVRGTSAAGCTATANQSITVYALPNVVINTTSATICSGQISSLTATGASSYTWTSGPSTAGYTVSPGSNSTYTVTGTSAAGCNNSGTQLIVVNALPSLTVVASPSIICSGNSSTLTASGAASYQWSGGPGTAAYAVTPTVSTTYSVTGTSVAGCTSTASRSVTVNSTPTVVINTSTNTICNGQSVSMIASGASTYSWTGGPATAGYNPSPSTSTTYVARGTSAAGCTATASQSITVNALPNVVINTTSATICSGQISSLTASGASSYTWTSGPSTAGYTVSPGSNATYTVTGTSAVGCTNTATQLVSVNALPSLTVVASPSIICSGNSSTLTASGAVSYQWSGGPGTGAYAVTPTVSTTYSVTGTSVAGCTSTASRSVTVNSTPTVVINTSTNTICNGQSVSMIASGASTYSWTGGPATAGYNPSPSTSTTYVARGTSAAGCTATASQSITVNALPNVVINTTSASICAGQVSSLTASGANTYVWTSGPSTAGYTVSPGSNATYTVTGTSAVGCTNTASQLVAVNALPSLTISASPTVICSGKTSTLTASGASTYGWLSGPATASFAVSPTSTSVYTVLGTSAFGCTNTAVRSVSVNATPTLSISASATTICVGNTTSLTASGANTYVWVSGPATAIYNVSPVSTTVYTVTGTTTASGCTNTAVQSISVNSLPSLSISTTGSIICAGFSTTLNASGATTFTWSGGPTSTAYSVSPSVTANYTVAGTNSANGCSNTAVQTVSVNALPSVSIAATSTVICVGKTTTLTASGANTYTWTSGPINAAYTVSPSSTAVYTVTGTNSVSGCSNTAVQTVSVNSNPVLTLTPTSTVICVGESSTLNVSGANTYVWSGGPSTSSYVVSPVSLTNYTVTGTNSASGCTTTAVQIVSVNALPGVFITPTSTLLCSGKTATLFGSGATTFTWDSGSTNSSISVTPAITTVYTLTGRNATTGCTNTAVRSISVNASPALTINPTSTVLCVGNSATLQALGASLYSWNTGPSTTSIVVSPAINTSYTLTGTAAISGCTSNIVQTMSVNALPVITASSTPTVVCNGKVATLSGGGGSTYVWTGGPLTGTYAVTPSITSVYTVTGTDAVTGCSNTAQTQVSVNALPTVSTTVSSTVICSSKVVTLTGTGANTYTWSGGPTTASYTDTPQFNTTYTVTGRNAITGCTNIAVRSISVNASPTMIIAPTSSVFCAGATTTLSGGGASSFTWTGGPVNTAYIVQPMVTTVYTLTGTDAASSCTGNAVQTISVNPLPSLTLTPSSTVICVGKTATFTVGGAGTYFWNTGATGPVFTLSPLSNSSYTVTGIAALSGCTSTAAQSMSVNILPTLSVSATSTVLCSLKPLTLTASGANTYTWVGGPTSATAAFSPVASIVYTVNGTDAVTNCSNSAVQSVSVNAIPQLTVTQNSAFVCSGSPVALTVSGADSYDWRNGPLTNVYTVTPLSSAIYTVTGTFAASGCTNSILYTVIVTQLPTLTISPPSTVICAGRPVTLTVSGASNYTWTAGPTSSVFVVNPTVTTTYTVAGVSPATSCSNTAQRIVNVFPVPPIGFSPATPTVCAGKTVNIVPTGAVSYTWLAIGSNTNISVSPAVNTTYTLTGTAANSCTNTATVEVTVNPLPQINVSGSSLICASQQISLTATGGQSYTWQPGAQNQNPVSVTPTASTVYTVTGKNAFSCTNTAIFQVNTSPLNAPSICVITVDSASVNNEIYWERGLFPQADTFIVYRETSANVYSPIGRVPKSAPGKFIDNNRFGLFHGDPNYASYKYKLQYRDTCGNLSAMSPYHQSIFIQDPKTGNFNWNSYAIENQVVNISYILVRMNILTGVTTTVGGTSANLYTDPNYATLAANGNMKWYVLSTMPECDPDLKSAKGKVATTKSNNTNERQFPVPVGVGKFTSGVYAIQVYPSPAHNVLYVNSPDKELITAQIMDMTGRVIYTESNEVGNLEINTIDIPSGVYLIKVHRNGQQLSMHRIVVQH